MIDSLLALYTKLKGGKCLIYIGREGRSVLEKLGVVQMIDVHLPTTDGRKVIMSRYTQPEPELQVLLEQLRLSLPSQPPPRVTAKGDVTK